MWKPFNGKGGSTINKKFIKTIRKLIDFLNDRKLLIGVGIGLIIATILMWGYKSNQELSKARIEEKAMEYGMKYPDEVKTIFDKEDVEKW